MRILLRHRGAKVDRLFAGSSVGKRVEEFYPWFGGKPGVVFESYDPESLCSSDIIFIALPSGEAMRIVPELIARGKKVIDLGGDFRLADAGIYHEYYGREHVAAEFLLSAIYGMPELNRERIGSAELIANPGCYPTSAILPLVPLLRRTMIDPENIIINSMSGASGAGRSSSTELSFCEVNENARGYKVGTHQHIPEIRQALELATGASVAITFTPHLIPITRGIYTTTCAPLAENISIGDIENAFEDDYGDEPFVRFSRMNIPEIKDVRGTNDIAIGFRIDEKNRRVILLSAIDNLVKGAAGQAVQNMNLLFGIEETEGLK